MTKISVFAATSSGPKLPFLAKITTIEKKIGHFRQKKKEKLSKNRNFRQEIRLKIGLLAEVSILDQHLKFAIEDSIFRPTFLIFKKYLDFIWSLSEIYISHYDFW